MMPKVTGSLGQAYTGFLIQRQLSGLGPQTTKQKEVCEVGNRVPRISLGCASLNPHINCSDQDSL